MRTAEKKEDDKQTENGDSFGNGQQRQKDEEEVVNMDNIITLNDETGKEVRFEFLDLVEYEGEQYVVLFPVGEDSNIVTILKVEDSNGDSDEETYIFVESEDTLTAVFEIFKEKFKKEFDFVD